ncbi:cytochrome C biogenesis protein [bacterium]|nr:cytochrome C biogenesis protein [bacterium]|tara:strand:+ start:135 stop:902 length:768 start_codon:yes stop_codon:yes gene_type:complete
MFEVSLIAAFVAGLITFLAPCTLPLVPGYLGFISGIPAADLNDPQKSQKLKWKVLGNGVFFILGFSAIFILLGTLIGFLGSTLAQYQIWLNRIGGLLIILFGLFMLDAIKIPFLQIEHRIKVPTFLKRGKPTSSFVLGAAFGTGWTPCVGPVLGAILTLSATLEGVLQGTFLLSVFSAGLAVPFLVIALGIGSAAQYIERFSRYLRAISAIGGLFLIFLGILLLFGKLGLLLTWGFQILNFLGLGEFEKLLLDYL